MSTDTTLLADLTHPAGPPAPATELTGGWLAGAWCLVAGALLLAVGGFVNSFSAVEQALRPSFGELAWTIPLLIDCGIAVFAGIDLLFTRLDMRIWWLRLIPWTLNAATIWLNVAHETDSVGVVAHAAAPILWIVTVELAGHFLRANAGLAHDPHQRRARGRLDRIRFSRWLLAPWSTLVIRRWMILQDERSFTAVYNRWWARKEAKWDLQNTYGTLLWRHKAPRELRGRYRYGHLSTRPGDDSGCPPLAARPESGPLAQHDDTTHPDRRDDLLPEPPAAGPAPGPPAAPGPSTRPAGNPAQPRRTQRARTAGQTRRADLDDVRRVVRQLEEGHEPANRTVVTQRIRAAGLSISNERADRLLADLDADDADRDRPAA